MTRPRTRFPVRPFDAPPRTVVESAKRIFGLPNRTSQRRSESSANRAADTGVASAPGRSWLLFASLNGEDTPSNVEAVCRSCRGRSGAVVLDLGRQPTVEWFPGPSDREPDALYPLQMWLCSSCGLAQLAANPTQPEAPAGCEPEALMAQAVDAVTLVDAAGWLPEAGRVAEYGSAHGGSWLPLLNRRGLTPAGDGGPADVVVDSFSLTHATDQSAALYDRTSRLAVDGVLLLQYHSLSAILRLGQWNALCHGHFAYYSTTALTGMLVAQGFTPRSAWTFDLYGRTVLLAATRSDTAPAGPDQSVQSLLLDEARAGVRDPVALGALQRHAVARATALRAWLVAERSAGRRVLGYGAGVRAVSLLRQAEIDRALLPAVADTSVAKHGFRLPGTDIAIIDPAELKTRSVDAVLLFVPELLAEVRAAFPEVEAAGGRWVMADAL